MIIIHNYDDFLLERYGYNKITESLSNKIINLININLGKLIYNKSITLNSSINKISDINFINDIINIKLSNRTYGNINVDMIKIKEHTIFDLILNFDIELSPKELNYKKLLNNKIINY